jgi:hypothetical protein
VKSPLVRWLLLVLLAFDLASSPFHAHLHELGDHGPLSWATASSGAAHADTSAPADHDDAVSGHVLTGVRLTKPEAMNAVHGQASMPSPEPALVGPATVESGTTAAAPPPRIPVFADRHLRPDGRAPPLLQA